MYFKRRDHRFPDRFAVVLREVAESKMARMTPRDLV